MSSEIAELRCTTCDRPVIEALKPCPWCGGQRHVEYAHWLARLGAWLLDGLFVWTAVIFVWLVVLDRFELHPFVTIAGAVIASWFWHTAWIASGDGATPGHRILGFGVRRTGTLEHVRFGRAFTREIIKTLTIIVGNGIKIIGDAVMIGVTDRRQSLHDMALDTVCVKDRFLEAPTVSHAVEPFSVDAPHLDPK